MLFLIQLYVEPSSTHRVRVDYKKHRHISVALSLILFHSLLRERNIGGRWNNVCIYEAFCVYEVRARCAYAYLLIYEYLWCSVSGPLLCAHTLCSKAVAAHTSAARARASERDAFRATGMRDGRTEQPRRHRERCAAQPPAEFSVFL